MQDKTTIDSPTFFHEEIFVVSSEKRMYKKTKDS